MITNESEAMVVTAAKSFVVSNGRLLKRYGAATIVELTGVMRMV